MYDTCPKCGHARKDSDSAHTCAACGLIYAKWMRRKFAPPAAPEPEPSAEIRSLVNSLLARLLYVEQHTDPVEWWGRAILLAGLAAWGWQFIAMDFTHNPWEIGKSVLHNVDLVFHEAGHVVFRPFGWFIMILGGTIGQLLIPAAVIGAFLYKRNPFGAAAGLWWLGQSFIDCAPYIDDAESQQLMLLGGFTGSDVVGAHDWNNILGSLHMVERHRVVATAADSIGTLFIIIAIVWGGWILNRQRGTLS